MGDLAPGFNGGQPVWLPPDSSGNFAALAGVAKQRDGKLVVAGHIGTTGSRGYGSDLPVRWVIQRFLEDGRLDPTFGAGGVVKLQMDPQSFVSAVVVMPSDQRILVGGSSASPENGGVSFVRLNADGSLDASFGGTGHVLLSRPEAFVRDTGTMALDASGNAYLAGWHSTEGETDFRSRGVIASVDPSGAPNGWAPGGILLPAPAEPGFRNVELASVAISGRTVFYAGSVEELGANGTKYALLGAVRRSDGGPVAGFGSGGLLTPAPVSELTGVLLGSDGNLKATGCEIGSGPSAGTVIASFKTSAADPTDRSFGRDGRVVVGGTVPNSPGCGHAITEQDGRLFVASTAIVPDESQGSTNQPALVGANATTGALDTRLGPDGFRVYSLGEAGYAGAIAATDRFVALAGSGNPPAEGYTAEGLLAVVETAPPAGALRVRQSHRRLRGGRVRVRVAGRLLLPSGVSRADGCGGSVAARFLRSGRHVLRRRTRVTSRCRYSLRATFAPRRVPTHVAVRFLGNRAVGASSLRKTKL